MTGMEVALILLLLRATSSSSVTHSSSNIPATEGCEVAIPAHTITSKLIQCSNRLKLRNVAKIRYINIRALIQADNVSQTLTQNVHSLGILKKCLDEEV